MTQADRVHSTPPTNTSATNPARPVDTTRRRFITIAAGASIISVGSLAAAAMPISATPVSALDPVFALIAEKRAADVAHDKAIDTYGGFDNRRDRSSDAAIEACENSAAACHYANEVDWNLATTLPTTLAGVAAVLRFANEIEDGGGEWPNTDEIGPDGWP